MSYELFSAGGGFYRSYYDLLLIKVGVSLLTFKIHNLKLKIPFLFLLYRCIIHPVALFSVIFTGWLLSTASKASLR
jgi:hypothetical protein